MIICLGIILFCIGCVMESAENASYDRYKQSERQHRELIESVKNSKELAPRKERYERRRYAQDKEGNILAEEVIKEIEQ